MMLKLIKGKVRALLLRALKALLRGNLSPLIAKVHLNKLIINLKKESLKSIRNQKILPLNLKIPDKLKFKKKPKMRQNRADQRNHNHHKELKEPKPQPN
jgi:hypothetical protein